MQYVCNQKQEMAGIYIYESNDASPLTFWCCFQKMSMKYLKATAARGISKCIQERKL